MTGPIHLPDITQDVKIDTSSLDKAIAQAKLFKAEMDKALKVDTRSFHARMQNIQTKIKDTNRTARDNIDGYELLASKLKDIADKAKSTIAPLNRVASETKKVRDSSAIAAGTTQKLASNIKDVGDQSTKTAVKAKVASKAVKDLGKDSGIAAVGVGLLGAALSVTNKAMTYSLITKTASLATKIGLIGGVVGVAGTGISNLATGLIGLGAAVGPAIGLIAALPSMLAGLGATGIAGFLALKADKDSPLEKSLDHMKKQFSDLSTIVQKQSNPAVIALLNTISKMAPAVKQGFSGLGESIGNFAGQLNKLISSTEFQNGFQKLMVSASQQADDYGKAISTFLGSITKLSVVAIPITEKIAQKISDLSTKFDALLNRHIEDGSLVSMLDKAYNATGRLIGLAKNLTLGFYNMGKATSTVGLSESFLSDLERGMLGIRNFASTYQKDFLDVAENSKGTITSLGKLISQVMRTIVLDVGKVNLTPLLDSLTTVVRDIGPMLATLATGFVGFGTDILKALHSVNGPLNDIFNNLSDVLGVLGKFGSGAIKNLAQPIADLTRGLAPFLQSIGKIVNDLLPDAANGVVQLVQHTQGALLKIAQGLAPIVSSLIGPVVDIATKIEDAVGRVADQVAGPLKTAVDNVIPSISTSVENVLPSFEKMLVAIGKLAAAYSDSIGGALIAVTNLAVPLLNGLTSVLNVLEKLPGPMKDVVAGIGAFALLKKVSIFDNLLGKDALKFSNFKGILSGVKNDVTVFTTGVGAAAATGSKQLGGFSKTMGAVSTGAGSLVKRGLGGIVGFLGGPWGLALAAGGIALSLFGASQQDAAKKEQEHKEKLEDLKDTVDSVTGAFTAATTKKIASSFSDDAIESFKKVGETAESAAAAVVNIGENSKQSGALIYDFNKKLATTPDVLSKISEMTGLKGNVFNKLSTAFKDTATVYGVSMADIQKASISGEDAINKLASRMAANGDTFDAAKSIINEVRDSYYDMSPAMKEFMDNLADAQEAQEQQNLAFQLTAKSAYENAKALSDTSGAWDGAGKSSDAFTKKLTELHDNGGSVIKALKDMGFSSEDTARIITGLGDAYDETTDSITGSTNAEKEHQKALERIADAAVDAQDGASELADAFHTLGDKASSASSKVNALQTILDTLAGNTKSVTDAQADWYDQIDNTSQKIQELVGDNKGFIDNLNATKGALNLQNSEQRSFYDSLKSTTAAFAGVNQALYDQVKAQNAVKGPQEAARLALDAVTKSAQKQRDEFMDTLESYGLTEEAAGKLADQLGLIPKNVAIALSTGGTDKVVQDQIAVILAKLKNLTSGHRVVVSEDEMTRDTARALADMGYAIEHLPDGTVSITDNTASVKENIDNLEQQVKESITGKVTINDNQPQAVYKGLKDFGYNVEHIPGGKVVISNNIKSNEEDVARLTAAVKAEKSGVITIDSQTTTALALQNMKDLGYTVQTLPDGTIQISTNSEETKKQLASVQAKLKEVPDGKSITITSLTADAIKALNDMGLAVTRNAKDTSFTVTPILNDAQFHRALQSLYTSTSNYSPYVNVGPRPGGFAGARGAVFRGVPGIVPMATGGVMPGQMDSLLRKATSMSNKVAQVVPPNTPRLIGDNVSKPELFVPLDPNNPRSRALMVEGIRAMGGISKILAHATGSFDNAILPIQFAAPLTTNSFLPVKEQANGEVSLASISAYLVQMGATLVANFAAGTNTIQTMAADIATRQSEQTTAVGALVTAGNTALDAGFKATADSFTALQNALNSMQAGLMQQLQANSAQMVNLITPIGELQVQMNVRLGQMSQTMIDGHNAIAVLVRQNGSLLNAMRQSMSQIAAAASRPPTVYVQNPFTGEYVQSEINNMVGKTLAPLSGMAKSGRI